MYVVRKFMMYDTDNKYIKENGRLCEDIIHEISKNDKFIELDINELAKKIDCWIINSKYKDAVNNILSE